MQKLISTAIRSSERTISTTVNCLLVSAALSLVFQDLLEGEGGIHSNLGCRDMFLKIVSLLKNYRSEGRKVYIFGKLSALAFQK